MGLRAAPNEPWILPMGLGSSQEFLRPPKMGEARRAKRTSLLRRPGTETRSHRLWQPHHLRPK